MFKLVDELLGVFFFTAIALHHLLPEFYNLIGCFIIGLFIAFTHIRRRDNNLGTDKTNLIQVCVVLERRCLIRGHQLGLESSFLPVGAKVLTDVKSSHVDDLIGFVQHFCSCIFPFQVRLLFPGQPLCVPLKPQINSFSVLCHLYMPPLIQKRNNRTVFNSLRDRIMGFHQFTEFGEMVLFLL